MLVQGINLNGIKPYKGKSSTNQNQIHFEKKFLVTDLRARHKSEIYDPEILLSIFKIPVIKEIHYKKNGILLSNLSDSDEIMLEHLNAKNIKFKTLA